METTSEDIKKLLPHSTVLDDEVFEETEVTVFRKDKKKQKSRLNFFCSKPSISKVIIYLFID